MMMMSSGMVASRDRKKGGEEKDKSEARETGCYRCNIHGDSGGICITLGNDSMSESKQKSSYEHGSDFERLRRYGHFLIPVHALM